VLELNFGTAPPPEEDVPSPESVIDVTALSWAELQVFVGRLLGELPAPDTESAIANAAPVTTNGGTIGHQ
jgi:hypothetical protein